MVSTHVVKDGEAFAPDIHRLFVKHEADFRLIGHRAHHVDLFPTRSLFARRGPAFRSIATTDLILIINPSLIAPMNFGSRVAAQGGSNRESPQIDAHLHGCGLIPLRKTEERKDGRFWRISSLSSCPDIHIRKWFRLDLHQNHLASFLSSVSLLGIRKGRFCQFLKRFVKIGGDSRLKISESDCWDASSVPCVGPLLAIADRCAGPFDENKAEPFCESGFSQG